MNKAKLNATFPANAPYIRKDSFCTPQNPLNSSSSNAFRHQERPPSENSAVKCSCKPDNCCSLIPNKPLGCPSSIESSDLKTRQQNLVQSYIRLHTSRGVERITNQHSRFLGATNSTKFRN